MGILGGTGILAGHFFVHDRLEACPTRKREALSLRLEACPTQRNRSFEPLS